mgnify:FL=1|jgi:hypothetical protein
MESASYALDYLLHNSNEFYMSIQYPLQQPERFSLLNLYKIGT